MKKRKKHISCINLSFNFAILKGLKPSRKRRAGVGYNSCFHGGLKMAKIITGIL